MESKSNTVTKLPTREQRATVANQTEKSVTTKSKNSKCFKGNARILYHNRKVCEEMIN